MTSSEDSNKSKLSKRGGGSSSDDVSGVYNSQKNYSEKEQKNSNTAKEKSTSNAFILGNVLYPPGLNRKQRRTILFTSNQCQKSSIDGIKAYHVVGREDGNVSDDEYQKIISNRQALGSPSSSPSDSNIQNSSFSDDNIIRRSTRDANIDITVCQSWLKRLGAWDDNVVLD